jgi:hypothetical protein
MRPIAWAQLLGLYLLIYFTIHLTMDVTCVYLTGSLISQILPRWQYSIVFLSISLSLWFGLLYRFRKREANRKMEKQS